MFDTCLWCLDKDPLCVSAYHIVTQVCPLPLKSRSRLQHGYCIGVSRRSTQVTVSEGLKHGPYMAARAGVEPTTLRLKVTDSTKAPPCLTNRCTFIHSFIHSGHFYGASSSPLLLRGAPNYSTDTVSEFHTEAHRQL